MPVASGRGAARWLGLALLCSGCAALVFETLWFRLAGLALGNSVWATSIVLASFMAGLAAGNAWAGRRAGRLRNAASAYAAIEALIAVSGLALVLALPFLNQTLAPVFRPLLERPVALNAMRALAAFLLLMVPATAMGATLPVAVKALSAHDASFGRVLGRLYGLNTVGGVAGALGAEFVLLPALGVRGSGVAAALLNLAAALCAWQIRASSQPAPEPAPGKAAGRVPVRLLAAAWLSGAALLALEVVWFRLLLLFMLGTSAHFAVMLAVVLAGIALGGLGASVWLARRGGHHRLAAEVALLASACTVATYLAYSGGVGAGRRDDVAPMIGLAVLLMLPTSVLSGLLFTLLGRAVHERVPDAPLATARLTLANTLGAMAGAVAGGFVLIPLLGAEASLFALAAAYGLVALLAWTEVPVEGVAGWERPLRYASLAAAGLLLAFFPFGRMQSRLLELVRRGVERDLLVVALREGRGETIQFVRRDLLGEPRYYRLITNGFSMSGTTFSGMRYMGLYVYWPIALRPRSESALLISYGVGVTARALVETRGLRSIDVVDTSREILGLSAIPFGAEEDPLRDPRVRVHVEDGRFFLQTTRRRFDLITGEPPPPKAAGIVNLYTQEYFTLMRARLTPEGLATYWLPVQELDPPDAKAIVRAFCGAFPDCTLWTGSAAEWMLVGSGGGGTVPSAEEFARQWEDPVVGSKLRAVALESPGHLGALFLGDAAWLAEYTRDTPPLTDDRPYRMSSRFPLKVHPDFLPVMDAEATRERFLRSEWVARNWPEVWRRDTAAAFREQAITNATLLASYGGPRVPTLALLHEALTRTSLRAVPMLLLATSEVDQGIADRAWARGERRPELEYLFGVRALSRREYAEAARRFGSQLKAWPQDAHAARLLALSQVLSGDRAGARATAASLRTKTGADGDPAFQQWLDLELAEPARPSS